ncbi:hypothetical protein ASZ90_017882 [hydrocarbon metagenome]|uniref:GTP cyclohydrolase 1 type 2 homolog n=1 Tax=hydrocarbon metagenome TaxID=938273 RepID=A0A0W8E7X5_9ZZZZ
MQARVKDVVNMIEGYFPLHLAESWDNPGLQIGSCNRPVERVLISLDLDLEILEKALLERADLIITHHPLFFKPMKSINFDMPEGALIKGLIRSDISVYSAHTNLDAGELGLSQVLAERLELQEITPLDNYKREDLLKIVAFVPLPQEEAVRSAMSKAGAGHIGKYSDCSFSTRGQGTFLPGEDTRPFIGEKGRLEEVEEFRLEMVLYKKDLQNVVEALKKAHPYEEAAYDIYHLENEYKLFSMGRKGRLKAPLKLKDLAGLVKQVLQLDGIKVAGDMDTEIKNAAVVSGAGTSLIASVLKQNIDVLVTGDVKYHEAKEAASMGLSVIDAGHQGTEQIVSSHLCNLLSADSQNKGFKINFIPGYSSNLFHFL